MTFAVGFSANAERDFLRAQAHYDEVAPHETDRFIAEVFAAARVLVDHPELGRPLRRDARRWHVSVFPHQLWYRMNRDTRSVRIIAVVGDAQDHQRFDDRLV